MGPLGTLEAATIAENHGEEAKHAKIDESSKHFKALTKNEQIFILKFLSIKMFWMFSVVRN